MKKEQKDKIHKVLDTLEVKTSFMKNDLKKIRTIIEESEDEECIALGRELNKKLSKRRS